jgi:hypothetical protein
MSWSSFLKILNRPGFTGDRNRLLEPLGNIPPAEFEKTYYTGQEGLAVGAGLK